MMKDCKNRKPLTIPPQGVKMPTEMVILLAVGVILLSLAVAL